MFRMTEKALNTTAFSWLKVGWFAKQDGFNQEKTFDSEPSDGPSFQALVGNPMNYFDYSSSAWIRGLDLTPTLHLMFLFLQK